ncbi:MAG: uroporphyrinogen decarboxylase family protein [Promethearchaeota archaeon]
MEKEGLFTTVVGSFPLNNTKENMTRAFNDEINVGIDYPCYPQLISMNAQFLSPLSKIIEPLKETQDAFHLSSDFEIPDEPVALEYGKFMVDFLKEHAHLKKSIKGTKACLTGPFTLASEIILRGELAKGIKPAIFNEPRAIMVDWIVDKLAEIMKTIGKAYNDMGVNIISMDEPILGLLVGRKIWFFTEAFIIKTLNKALSGIKELSSIHVCGRISPYLRDILLQTDVKIMDHEFRTNEKNFDIFQKKHFENTGKYLAMGTIQTKCSPIPDGKIKDYVEDVSFLKNFIKKGIALYGKNNLIIKPDCGFGPLLKTFGGEFGYEITLKKLNNMVLALKEIK